MEKSKNNLNVWDQFYKNTPLDKIPWQKNKADFLTDIINSKKVKVGTALDLGCGTGMKSIFLRQNNFEVTGVDISKQAIQYAKDNADKEKVKIDFFVKDATDLSFLDDKKFDLILDWANLHGIEKSKIKKYIDEIIQHTKIGSKLILRCFGYEGKREPKTEPLVDANITLFTENDIENLYGKHFKILETNKSNSQNKNAPSKFFHEFLMERFV